MFLIRDRATGGVIYPTYRGRVEKAYRFRSLAEHDAKEVSMKSKRVDVVELSLHAQLYMENQARLAGEVACIES